MKSTVQKLGLVFGLCSLLPCNVLAQWDENILALKVREKGLSFDVLSNGCTSKSSFTVERVEGTDGKLEISLHRDTPDMCKMVSHVITLGYSFEELGVKDAKSLSVVTATARIDIKRQDRLWPDYRKTGMCIADGVQVQYSLDHDGKSFMVVTKNDKVNIFAGNYISIKQMIDSLEINGTEVLENQLLYSKLILPKTTISESYEAILEEQSVSLNIGATIDNDPNLLLPLRTKLQCTE